MNDRRWFHLSAMARQVAKSGQVAFWHLTNDPTPPDASATKTVKHFSADPES